MMKTRIAVVVVALSFTAAALSFGETKKPDAAASPAPAKTTKTAQSPAPAKTDKTAAPQKEAPKMNPQMGTWKLNEGKSKLVPGMGKNHTVVYAMQRDNIKVTVDGTDKDGKKTHSVWLGKWDGKAYPTKGNVGWTHAAYKVVNEYANDITTMKDGKVVWTGRIEVAKDGKSRTVTINGTGADGKKFKGKAVYDKA